MTTRSFRTPESYQEEGITRGMLSEFLARRGFKNISDERTSYGNRTESQTIHATSLEGQRLAMRVRLCWRGKRTYAGAQILSAIKNNDWEGSINEKIRRDQLNGVTHFLIVHREGEQIKHAALVPLQEVLSIWREQRNISAKLIRQGVARSKKNHAMNGSSPTLYLQDDSAPQVALALWRHKGVSDLSKLITRLPDDEADPTDLNDERYEPTEGDFRNVIQQQIRQRRGQQQFRDALRLRFDDCCVVTGSKVLAVLEAAHITPYRGAKDNHPENGLLLRADIHTLFDLDLVGINPDRLVVELHPDLVKEYGHLEGALIKCTPDNRPSREALKLRYEVFLQNLHKALSG